MNGPMLDLARGAPASPVLGFFRSEETRNLIAAAVTPSEHGELVLSEGGLDVAVKVMRRGEKPGLVVYDVGASTNPIADILTIIKHGGRSLPVIAIGGTIDTAQFREFLAAGVFDYLDLGLGPRPLTDSVSRARRERTRRATDIGPARQGRLIVFCGTRGGVGTTTAAIATAWTLAHERETSTALLDLDMNSGTVAFALDIDPGRGLREGLDQPSRIDTVYIERCLVRESPRLAVLSAEEPFDSCANIDPVAAIVLLDELRQSFDCVVVDMPRVTSALTRAVLGAADDIVLVSSPTLAGLRDGLRWLEFVAAFGDRAVVRVVQGPVAAGAALDIDQLEKSLGRKIDLVIPFDAKGVATAANEGKSLPAVAPGSAVAKAFVELANLLGFPAPSASPQKKFRWPWRNRDADL